MKYSLVILLITFFCQLQAICQTHTKVKVGDKLPDYLFSDIINRENEIRLSDFQGKPVLLEFWATWCGPCIPAMKKLESIQEKYGDRIAIVTVSGDKRERLINFHQTKNSKVPIAFDTVHQSVFDYRFVPHIVVADKYGKIVAFTTPQRITDEIIDQLIAGQDIVLDNVTEKNASSIEEPTAAQLIAQANEQEFSYKLTTANSTQAGTREKIDRNEQDEPFKMDLRNVTPRWLFINAYQITSSVKLTLDGVTSKELGASKYCLDVETYSPQDFDLFTLAQNIINNNFEYRAERVAQSVDTSYSLKIIDPSLIPKMSEHKKSHQTFMGPMYTGKRVKIKEVVSYLENQLYCPVIDETALKDYYDIELDWQYENPITLNRELGKYGLKLVLVLEPREVEMLRIYKD